MITSIMTYHWNNGRGTGGLGKITLRNAGDGPDFGPWAIVGSPGSGGVPNAYWTVRPNVVIPAGTYAVFDSDPATWAQNFESDGRGMAIVKGYPSSGNATTKAPVKTPTNKEVCDISGSWFAPTGPDVVMVVVEQNGNKFSGTKTYSHRPQDDLHAETGTIEGLEMRTDYGYYYGSKDPALHIGGRIKCDASGRAISIAFTDTGWLKRQSK